MKKIGLITIHNTINFGSQLQTYGLYKAIESMGYDIEIIDYTCEAIANRESTLPLKDAKSPKDIIKSLLLHRKLQKRKDSFQEFMTENTKISETYSKETIKKSNNFYDTFIVGSDIVWGLSITGNDFTYMLDFVEESKCKLAFASSVGTKWDEEKSGQVQCFLGRFNSIAVREEDAAEWISKLLSTTIDVVCDPTMLWDGDFWGKVAEKYKKTEKYVLVYMSDPDNKCVKSALEYGKKHGLSVYYINYRAPVWGTKDKRPTSLEEWIGLFLNADVVFSASYHGLLFSLYFHKQVFYFNWVNKSRMYSLSKAFKIEHREGTTANIMADIPIDYSIVDKLIEDKRRYSWDKLRKMLDE